MLKLLLNLNDVSLYRLEKDSHLSHATLNDLYNEKTNVEKCSSVLLHDIATSLKMSMDHLYSILSYDDLSLISYNSSFDLFKSNVCHELKELDYKDFLKKHLNNKTVKKYFDNDNKLEALYILSLIDYLCLSHNLPLIKEYDEIRQYKMNKLYVSESIYLLLRTKRIKLSSLYKEAIPSFMNHNIMEANIYDVQ